VPYKALRECCINAFAHRVYHRPGSSVGIAIYDDRMKETVQANYRRIKEEVKQIVQEELERIANDENLKHLLQQK
jgi:hypothetical protein